MSAAANNNTTTNTNTNTENPGTKRTSAFHVGLEKMRNDKILKTSKDSLKQLAKIVTEHTDNAFDLLYLNMPWKTISMEYAANLPVNDLVAGKENAGLLLWVDSPCVQKATKLLDVWGFQFHSVLHVTSYTNPATISATPGPDTAAAEATAETVNEVTESNNTTEVVATEEETKTTTTTTNRKNVVPHGWMVDGIVPSKSRQLWFATRGNDTSFLKDTSFIRKRLQATSEFVYSKANESTILSSKKKNLDSWQVFPEYDAYVPSDILETLETIHKPASRVLSLFGNSLSRNWYTWGPNIPGYLCCPAPGGDSGFPVMNALLKYFTSMKGATVQKYLTLMNLYAVQYAKQLGSLDENDENGQPKQHLTPIVTGRMTDFFTDLLRKYHEGGGVAVSVLASASKVNLESLPNMLELQPDVQTQVLLLVAQVIRVILKKNADATERRKKAIKRKRELNPDEEGVEGQPKERMPRKFGIAAPVDISDNLAKFLDLPPGEKVARTTVVKQINEYISKNNLQNPSKKSEINCDEALLKLLNPGPNFGQVTYFNLCKLLGPHFYSSKKPTGPVEGKPLPPGLNRSQTQGVRPSLSQVSQA